MCITNGRVPFRGGKIGGDAHSENKNKKQKTIYYVANNGLMGSCSLQEALKVP